MEKPRVSRITIGRLYNLGNYEHIRYEIAADIPDGEDAANVIVNLESILGALNPKPEAAGGYHRGRLKELIEIQKAGSLTPSQAETLADLQKQNAAYRHGVERREKARAALNDLGGTTVFTDAKDKWDDEYEYPEL